MSIKKIKQTGEDTKGVYNSQDALSFARILNNNADELGTSTKLDLFYRNTPQAIRKALREQSERNINFHTPGGPDELATSEQTVSVQKGGVAQTYNEALSGDEPIDTLQLGNRTKFVLKNSYDHDKVDAFIDVCIRADSEELDEDDLALYSETLSVNDYPDGIESSQKCIVAGYNHEFGSYGYIDFWDNINGVTLSYLSPMQALKDSFENMGFSSEEVNKLDYGWYYIDMNSENFTFTKCPDISTVNIDFVVRNIGTVDATGEAVDVTSLSSEVFEKYFTAYETEHDEDTYRLVFPDYVDENMKVGEISLVSDLYEYASNEDNKTWYVEEDDAYYAPIMFVQGDRVVKAFVEVVSGRTEDFLMTIRDRATNGGSLAIDGQYFLYVDLFIQDGVAMVDNSTVEAGLIYRYTINIEEDPYIIHESTVNGIIIPEGGEGIAYECSLMDYFYATVGEVAPEGMSYNTYLYRIVQGDRDESAFLTNIREISGDKYADFSSESIFVTLYHDIHNDEIRFSAENMRGINVKVEYMS